MLEMTKLALNIHLSKQFDDNNNNVAVEENFQRRFSVNVWCGIFGDRMDLWVPFLLIAVSIKQNIILFIIKRNKQLSG
jgi:hypothetical protein